MSETIGVSVCSEGCTQRRTSVVAMPSPGGRRCSTPRGFFSRGAGWARTSRSSVEFNLADQALTEVEARVEQCLKRG